MNEKFIRPKYDGAYVGQTQTTHAQTVLKSTCWEKKHPETHAILKDPVTGEPLKGYGKIEVIETIMIVWDGKDWQTMSDFRKSQVPNHLRGAKTVEEFLAKGGRIRRV